jgi:hypothetical protein
MLENDPQCLPWQRFSFVDYYNGYYITIREGTAASPWQKIEVAEMLNLCVFLPLTTHIKNSLLASNHNATIDPIDEEESRSEEEIELIRQMQKGMLERNKPENILIPVEVAEALHILELPASASIDVIHQRYRQLAKQYHPDAGGDSETFRRINAAYTRVIAWITSNK